jgi:glucose-1-phosphate thymidylyltransferase
MGRGYAWLDTGTHESMLHAANFIHTIETRQGLQVACLQEIAFENGWLTAKQIREGNDDLLKTEYGQYLMRITEGK